MRLATACLGNHNQRAGLRLRPQPNTKTPMKDRPQIHTTTDYSLFSHINGNREVSQLHLERLRKSMSDNYLFTVIFVNEKHQIIDGQHRFEAIKSLGLPLNYVILEGKGLQEVQTFNLFQKKWTTDDYLHGYLELGKSEYAIYKSFKDRYGFGHNETMAMLAGMSANGGGQYQHFINGTFRVTHLEEATRHAERIWMFNGIYSGYQRRTFVFAMLYLFNKPNFEFIDFYNKIKAQPSLLTHCNDAKQYVHLIEEIYNYRRREKVSLRY
jgi:hypothetical protein